MLPSSIALALGLVLASSVVQAGNHTYGEPCNINNNKLSPDTKQFTTDCTATTYCASNGTCLHKGCRRDEYPFGYRLFAHVPDKCPKGEFCPDEEDACLALLPVGSPCQLNRDDECEPPPNASELSGPNNHNGSVCLNYQCMWANATLGNDCVVENTPYTGYEAGTGKEFVNVVSRGNCVTGLYCDAPTLKCLLQLDEGQSCQADKECTTDNCLASGVCGPIPNAAHHLASGVFVAVGLCIALIMGGTLGGLYFVHRRHRGEEREKRAQYWREQEQFRQNIMQMREQARTSILSLPWQGQTSPRTQPSTFDRDYPPSENSQTGILYAAAQPSGLRNEFSDSGYDDTSKDGVSTEETLVMRPPKGSSGAASRRAGGKRI